MKTFLLALAAFYIASPAQASDFRVAPSCQRAIQQGLKGQNLELLEINSTFYHSPNSDRASRWGTDYAVNAFVRTARGETVEVLIAIQDSYNCRVIAVNKAR